LQNTIRLLPSSSRSIKHHEAGATEKAAHHAVAAHGHATHAEHHTAEAAKATPGITPKARGSLVCKTRRLSAGPFLTGSGHEQPELEGHGAATRLRTY